MTTVLLHDHGKAPREHTEIIENVMQGALAWIRKSYAEAIASGEKHENVVCIIIQGDDGEFEAGVLTRENLKTVEQDVTAEPNSGSALVVAQVIADGSADGRIAVAFLAKKFSARCYMSLIDEVLSPGGNA